MTRIVILGDAPTSSIFDETAVFFGRTLAASDFAALYGSMLASYTADAQNDIGWEEIYGGDQPLTTTDVPVLTNGITRVRYIGANSAYAVDVFQGGVGWVEEGRFTVWTDDGGTITQHGNLVDADVVEWTPERATIRVTTMATNGVNIYRLETYISLQRGWNAPRVECYPSPNQAGLTLGAHVRWSPYGQLDPFSIALGSGAANFKPFYDSLGAWPGGTDDFTVTGSEPWVAHVGGDRTTAIAVTRAGVKIRRYDDVTAYGVVRRAVAVCADFGTSLAGYVSARLGFAPEARFLESDRYVNPGGTRTVVVDAAGNEGDAVNDTQTTQAASTMLIPLAAVQAMALPLGKYGIWVRARVTTAGDTGTVAAGFNGGTNTPGAFGADFTSTTYVWVYAGEGTYNDASTGYIVVNAWRKTGAGTTGVRVDEVVLVPLEQRLGADPAYDGVRDLAASNLYDARNIPTLINRS